MSEKAAIYRALEDLSDKMVRSAQALESVTVQFAVARAEADATAMEFESALARAGIPYDSFAAGTRSLNSRLELCLWAETDGKFLRARTLDSPAQVKKGGLASPGVAAEHFRAVTLRDTRDLFKKLGFPIEETT